MNDLERRYRWLMKAYPGEHREAYENEMVTTLLDVAVPGQHWPRPRETVAIVRHGVGCRVRAKREWIVGVRWGALASLSVSVSLSVWLFVVAVLPPRGSARRLAPGPGVGISVGPILLWGAVAVLLVVGALMPRGLTRVPLVLSFLVLALVVVVGRSPAPMLRRDLVPLVLFVGLSLLSSAATLRARVTAVSLGLVGAFVLLVRFVNKYGDMDFGRQGRAAAWNVVDRWALASWSMHLNPLVLSMMVIACLCGGLWRLRLAVAGVVLAVPLGLIALRRNPSGFSSGSLWMTVAVAVLLCVACAGRSWKRRVAT